MRYYGSLLLTAMLLPAVALAQQSQPSGQESGAQGAASDAFMTSQSPDQVTTDDLVGSSVTNQQGEQIGTISALILDQSGEVAGVVVGVGGFLGIGQKDVAVSWDEVEITRDPDNGGFVAMMDMNRQRLEDAPEFTRRGEQQDQPVGGGAAGGGTTDGDQ